ncbi:ubiquitin-conjugating enzyme [Trifolium repens]|nr:ubiquitin-conjugating enzyme [Trifolium repens]
MDPDVVEIPPSLHQKPSRFKKQKHETVFHDMIDLEGDDDLLPGFGKSGIQSSNGQPSASHNLINVGGQGSNPLFVEDDYVYKFSDDYMDEDEYALLLQAQFDNVDLPTLLPEYDLGESQHFELDINSVPGDESSKSNFNAPPEHAHPHGLESRNHSLKSSYNLNAPPEHEYNGAPVVSPCLTSITDKPENETLRKLRSFKQFDTVVDTSDHYFVKNNSTMLQNPKSWAKQIQVEWKILEKYLPDTIFVRVFESRMDLLRAVIIGAEGTPYHDGLFFFDVLFPSGYPNVPPQVHYHARGLRLNPNLYASGKVCLSLLNTWSGRKNEKWTPGVSTMLQVLVSIQSLILNAKPYFNEPGYANTTGTQNGEAQSLKYNENTFILSVRTMMYTIKRPPQNFEELVRGHFYSRAHDILASCKVYMEDVQVGCFVKGRVRGVHERGRKYSDKFKADLLKYVKLLVQEFEKLGVKDYQKIMSTTSPKQPTLWYQKHRKVLLGPTRTQTELTG